WFDEAGTMMLAALPFGKVLPLLISNEMSPPLYFVMMHFWLKAFADPRLGLRVFSVLCGVASLVVFRSLCERLLPKRARLLGLFIAAFSSYWIHAAQDGRVYSLLILVALLCARSVLALEEAPTPRRWAAYACWALLGLNLHYYFAFSLVAHALWLGWRFRRSAAQMKAWATAHLFVLLALTPWAFFLPQQLTRHVHDFLVADPLTFRHLGDLLGTMFFDVTYLGLALPAWLTPAIGAGFAAAAIVGAVRLAARLGPDDERAPLSFIVTHLAVPLALIMIAELMVGRPITQARYFFALSPWAYLLAAFVFSSARRAMFAPRLLLEAVLAAGVVGYFASSRIVDPRFEALAAAIRRGSTGRDPVVYIETYYYLPMRLYYLPERANFLISEAAEVYDYSAIPPYDGVIGGRHRSGLPRTVVVDGNHALSPRTVWLGTGPVLAAAIARTDPRRLRHGAL
ncbi:MAG: glycosyltransferase family 39 protein, partial [Elusimicrobia bacterium]|nr:glycosyltransferase family 39 protein [Elusimicrobiota bacterium]